MTRTIDFGPYLSSLCARLESLDYAKYTNIKIEMHQCDSLFLDLDTVTALGLAISELIANSYAHAFPDGTGLISVALSINPQRNAATVVFADNGIGFSETGNSQRHGLGLMKRLMEQVRGSATLQPGRGARWIMEFPVPPVPAEFHPGLTNDIAV